MKGIILKPLGERNSSYVQDAPNYIATLDVVSVETAALKPGWSILRGIWN